MKQGVLSKKDKKVVVDVGDLQLLNRLDGNALARNEAVFQKVAAV